MFFRTYNFLCILVIFFIQAGIAHAQNERGSMLKKVVIDPGHGGHDPGAIGYAKSKEKDIVLDISLRIGKMIHEKYPDVEVIYTRKTDVFAEHYKRTEIANKANANLFISIHANSVAKGSKCPSGADCYVMGYDQAAANMEVAKRENAVILLEEDYKQRYEGFDPSKPETFILLSLQQNSFQNQSIDFAGEIQDQFKTANRVSRGVRQALLYVMYKTAMPSVLVEVGFICNPEEEKFLTSAAGKDKLATAIFQAFCSYKSKIDDRSSFDMRQETGDVRQGIGDVRQGTGDVRQETGDVGQETGNHPTSQISNLKSQISKPQVEFCVQISTSSKPMNTTPSNFKKYKNVERIQVTPNSYKYIVGRTANYATAQETLKKVRVDFKDAFVVSIVDGKIIPAAEGLKLITK